MKKLSADYSCIYGPGYSIQIQGWIFCFLFLAGGLVEISRGQPPYFFILLSIFAFFLTATLLRVRLGIGSNGIFVQKIFGYWQTSYSDVTDICLGSISSVKTPTPVPVLYVKTKCELRKLNLRLFSVAACAALFTAFEKKGLKIKRNDDFMVRVMVYEIRREQRKQKTKMSLGNYSSGECL